jgi:hypothetical protein
MRAGRVLEVGPPKELYFHPRTEYVAAFLGTSNLLVGTCDEDGVSLGPVRFPLGTESRALAGSRRVQVLFRPEDVAVRTSAEALGRPLLGEGVVLESTFAGSIERLRIKIPRLPGVRPIAPAVPFGDDSLILEASRPQDQAQRYPLGAGDSVWVGVRRLHALPDPGLSILLVAEETPESRAAVELGGGIAKRAHARVSVLACDSEDGWVRQGLQALREGARAGLAALETRNADDPLLESILDEATRRHFDLIVQGMPSREGYAALERQLEVGDHHVLLVPSPCPLPENALICVAVGEPGKEDVRFAGQLARHVGASATIACVLPEGAPIDLEKSAARFLAAGERTLALLDVPSRAVVRRGPVREPILDELRSGLPDLLVLGAPLPNRRGVLSLDGFVGDLLDAIYDRPVLIVRSHEN